MAHKKGLGSSRNGRDSRGQRLGTKRFDGQTVKAGEVLVEAKRHRPSTPARTSAVARTTPSSRSSRVRSSSPRASSTA